MSQLVFTRPELLWGLLAALLPLVVHLLNRYRARRQRFAAIDFLVKVRRRTARRLLFRHVLLLAVRTMLIAALALAAAGPVWRLAEARETKGPVNLVMIIDRSFSMRSRFGDTTRFDIAVKHAKQVVSSLRDGDRICLIAAGVSIDVLVEPCTDFPRILEEQLDVLKPGWGRSNLSEAMQTAASLLADVSGSHGRILLLTDGSDHAFPGPAQWPEGSESPEVVVQIVDREGSRDNRCVDLVEPVTRGRYLEITARLCSYAACRQDQLLTQVRMDQDVLAQGFVDLPPRQTVRKVFNVPNTKSKVKLEAEGSIHDRRVEALLGKVVLPEDILPEDDQRLFLMPEQRSLKTLLVNGDMRQALHRDELFYLEHALSAVSEGSSGILYSTIMPDRLDAERLDSVDVVFLANIAELPREAVASLRSFVSSGGGLFISVGDRIQVDRTNNMLADLLPCPLRDVIDLGPAESNQQHKKGMAFADLRVDHPVLSLFAGEAMKSLRLVRTWRAAVVEPDLTRQLPGVLIRYANDLPALVERSYKRGKVMLFTSSMDRDWTSWPARASFLPFVQRVTSYLAGQYQAWSPLEVAVGEQAKFRVSGGSGGVQVIGPDGAEYNLEAEEARGREVSFRQTLEPGWYRVLESANHASVPVETIPGFLVHPPLQESDLTLVAPERLEKLVGKASMVSWVGTSGYAGHQPCWIFLFLAIFLVMLEALLEYRET